MKIRPDQVPPAPRILPDWFKRLELKPRKRRFLLFSICFIITLGVFSYLTAKQISFEWLRSTSALVSAKVMKVSKDSFQYEIYLEEEELNYILTEKISGMEEKIKPGEKIEVYFLKSNPSKSLSEFSTIHYELFIAFSFLTCSVFILLAFYHGREYFRRKDSYELGEPVSAKIVSWDENSGSHAVKIRAEEQLGVLHTVVKLPRYVSRVPVDSEVLALHYNGYLAYYWNAEEGLSTTS